RVGESLACFTAFAPQAPVGVPLNRPVAVAEATLPLPAIHRVTRTCGSPVRPQARTLASTARSPSSTSAFVSAGSSGAAGGSESPLRGCHQVSQPASSHLPGRRTTVGAVAL